MPAACRALTSIAKFGERVVRVAATRIAIVGGEETERHVAPMTAFLRIVLMNRHQLDGGNT